MTKLASNERLIRKCELRDFKGKEYLLQLEKEGNFLFHGSAIKLDSLEPRQSYTIPRGEKEMIKDGDPAVAATPYVKIAIFRAIVNNHNTPKGHRSGFGDDNGILQFRASQLTLGQVKGKNGYVYVLDRKGFKPRGKNEDCMEWRSEKTVKPICFVVVTDRDLPNNIEIMKETFSSTELADP